MGTGPQCELIHDPGGGAPLAQGTEMRSKIKSFSDPLPREMMPRVATVFAMRYAAQILIAVSSIAIAGLAAAQIGLWSDSAGLGLRPSGAVATETPGDPYAAAQVSSPDFTLYRGTRDTQRLGVVSSENYSGVTYPLSRRWGSSFEAGVIPESMSAPRRYSLSGEVGAALAKDHSLSVGLKLRHYDSASAIQPYSALSGGNGYALAPSTFDSSYEVRLNYRYGESSSFGFALGRDLEALTPGLASPLNGDRQLMFTGQHALTPNWGLTYDLLSDDPGLSMRVQGVRLGVRYRF